MSLAENDVTESQALMREAIRNTNCEGKALVMSCRTKGEITVTLSRRRTSPYLQTRSLKSVLVLPPQIFGLFGPPRKRVNFDKFNQRQKCVFCVLTALYVSK